MIPSEAQSSNYPWLLLWIRPTEFFSAHALKIPPRMYYLAAVVFCLAAGIEQVDKRIMKGDGWALQAAENWGVYWLAAVAGALVSILTLAIGSWWYEKRVGNSKGTMDSEKAKRLYLFSSLIWAIPAVLITVLSTIFEPNALGTEDVSWIGFLSLLGLIFPFYSVIVSYAGVKTLHAEANSFKLRLWFLILPMLVYGVGTVGAILVIVNQ